tara:strand:+ start:339 stop:617 length:279 start_codon:yes stop_codon:yes gene_type:complete
MCNICGIFISFLDFLIMVVVISSLVIWRGSVGGLETFPDEKDKWQKQLDEAFLIFIISSGAFLLSIIVNNCFLEKYSNWYNCCDDNSVYPDV